MCFESIKKFFGGKKKIAKAPKSKRRRKRR
jgi:hypothetical protein